MQNTDKARAVLIAFVGIALSLWLGAAIVTDQVLTLIKVGAVGLILVAALSGHRIWLLMVLLGSMDVNLARGFGTAEIGRAMFVGFGLAMFLMRRLRFQVRFGELEAWILVIIICIAQVYMRNPVGLNILGGGSVGGKPYIFMALTIFSSIMLSTLLVPARELKWAMALSIIGRFLSGPLSLARGGASIVDTETGQMEGRVGPFRDLGHTIARWFVAYKSPLGSIFNPGWVLVMLISVGLSALSGYRNAIAGVGLIYAIAICYHSGLRGLVGSMFVGGIALVCLALFNMAVPLPMHVQRALSPLPGSWDEKVTKSAEDSTDWRWEMWMEALTTDRWIESKLLGDGLGMTRRELERNKDLDAANFQAYSGTGLTNQQVNMLVTGSYHSGPVHTIRTVGYLGLLVLLLAQIRVAVYAHRQIMRCRGTEWGPFSLYVGIPMISAPIFFVFVFGEYHTSVAMLVTSAAYIRLMERNIPLPAYVPRKRRAHVPLAIRNQGREQRVSG